MELLENFFTKYEYRRKTVHFVLGISFVIFINYYSVLKFQLLIGLALTLLIALILSAYTKHKRPQLIISLLSLFDKPHDLENYPGKGAIYYLSGVLIAIAMFERNIASASILILAVSDPIAHIVGRMYGKTKVIINQKKLLEGTVAGIFAGTVAAMFFVPFPIAFFGAAFGMMAETIEIELFHFDDNFFIPFISGCVMSIIHALL